MSNTYYIQPVWSLLMEISAFCLSFFVFCSDFWSQRCQQSVKNRKKKKCSARRGTGCGLGRGPFLFLPGTTSSDASVLLHGIEASEALLIQTFRVKIVPCHKTDLAFDIWPDKLGYKFSIDGLKKNNKNKLKIHC